MHRLAAFTALARVVSPGEPGLATTFTQVGAFPLTAGSRDAALLLTLNAGASYTVQVDGVGGGTGEALIEIYEIL